MAAFVLMIEIFLPFPPTVNNYYVKTSRGIYISQKGKKFREAAHAEIIKQIGAHADLPADSPISVSVIVYPPDRRKRDLDNYMKSLLDAITHSKLIWEDDSLIDQLFIYRGQVTRLGQIYLNVNLSPGPIIPIDSPHLVI